MSRELPYFKFFTGEWLNGDITLEDYELQGLFVNICAYYWHKEGINIDILILEKKFRTHKIIDLYNAGLIYEDEDEKVRISFLDEQLSEFKTRKKKLSDAGKKGAKRKKEIALNKPSLSNAYAMREDKDKIIEDKIIEDKIPKFSFKDSLMKKGVDKILIAEWLKVRKSKKLTNSQTAYRAIEREFEKIDILPHEIIKICVENSWAGFKAEWIKNKQNGLKGNTQTNRARTTTSERQTFD